MLFKKGDKAEIKNYTSMTLLNVIYKLPTKILTTIFIYQSREQAGFRKGFSTYDHLTMIILIEKANEYQISLFMTFIDFEKVFDSIEHCAIKHPPHNSRTADRCTELIMNIYTGD